MTGQANSSPRHPAGDDFDYLPDTDPRSINNGDYVDTPSGDGPGGPVGPDDSDMLSIRPSLSRQRSQRDSLLLGHVDGQDQLGLGGEVPSRVINPHPVLGASYGHHHYDSQPQSVLDLMAYQWSNLHEKGNGHGLETRLETALVNSHDPGLSGIPWQYNQQQQQYQHYHHHYPYPNLETLHSTYQTFSVEPDPTQLVPNQFQAGLGTFAQHQQQYPGSSSISSITPMREVATASSASLASPDSCDSSLQGPTGATTAINTERTKWTRAMDQCVFVSKMKGMKSKDISNEMKEKFPGTNTTRNSLSKRYQRIQERYPDPVTQAVQMAMPRIMDCISEKFAMINNRPNTIDKNIMFHPKLAVILVDDQKLCKEVIEGLPRAFTKAAQKVVDAACKNRLQKSSSPASLVELPLPRAVARDGEFGERWEDVEMGEELELLSARQVWCLERAVKEGANCRRGLCF